MAKINPTDREVMVALAIMPGAAYSKPVRKLIKQRRIAGESFTQIINTVRVSGVYQSFKDRAKNSPLDPNQIAAHFTAPQSWASTKACEALNVTKKSICYTELRRLIVTLAAQNKNAQQIIAEVMTSKEWAARLNQIANAKRLEEERAEKARLARIAKGNRIKQLPRDQRLAAWGMFRPRMLTPGHGGILQKCMAKTDAHFKQLTNFAKYAQKHVVELAEQRRKRELQEQANEKIRQRKQEEYDRQREARLMALENEITLEDAQRYVRENIPDYRLEEFRRYFRKNHDGDKELLVYAVNQFLGATAGLKALVNVAEIEAPVAELAIAEVVEDVAEVVAGPEEKEAAAAVPAPVPEFVPVPEKKKREGKRYGVTSRPDQASFSSAVRFNCFEVCVVTGSRITRRCEAAHLIEHKNGGADSYRNGLWMRADIHDLFDAGMCAINPETLVMYFTEEALALDADLLQYHGKRIGATRRPINPAYLAERWEAFEQ